MHTNVGVGVYEGREVCVTRDCVLRGHMYNISPVHRWMHSGRGTDWTPVTLTGQLQLSRCSVTRRCFSTLTNCGEV